MKTLSLVIKFMTSNFLRIKIWQLMVLLVLLSLIYVSFMVGQCNTHTYMYMYFSKKILYFHSLRKLCMSTY